VGHHIVQDLARPTVTAAMELLDESQLSLHCFIVELPSNDHQPCPPVKGDVDRLIAECNKDVQQCNWKHMCYPGCQLIISLVFNLQLPRSWCCMQRTVAEAAYVT
jgi:hypothetical protein